MFEHFVGAKVEKRKQRTRTIAIVSVVVHAGFLLGLLVHGFWQIERLGMPKREITLAVAPALEVPPPPAPSVKRPPVPENAKVRTRPKDTTQPVNKPPDETPDVEIVTEDIGAIDGIEGGDPGGHSPLKGIETTSLLRNQLVEPPPPAPDAPKKPARVEPTIIEAQRIDGEKLIQPDDGTKLQMARDGRSLVKAQVKMCLSARGDVASTRLVQSSGYGEYDARILATMQAWRYQPFLVNDEPTPVCTEVTFIYRQQ